MARTSRRLPFSVWLLLPAVLIVGGAAWFGTRSAGGTSSAASTRQRVFTVTRGPFDQTVAASGTIAATTTQSLSFSAAGTVTAVNVHAGQQVVVGQVLSTIDSAALQNQVAQAQATLATDEAKLASDESASASAAQLAADRSNQDAAQASLNSAQTALADATLTSPINGTITTVNLTVGEQLASSGSGATSLAGTGANAGASTGALAGASTGTTSSTGSAGGGSGASGGSGGASSSSSSASNAATPQVQVVSTGSFVVNLSVDDTQIGHIAAGQKATIAPSTSTGGATGTGGFGAAGSAGATPADSGVVYSVGTVATTTSGVASFPVVVAVNGSPSDLFAGATANVTITYNEIPNVLQVPAAAITRTTGASSVAVQTPDGKKHTQTVQTGQVASGEVEVTSGLNEGDQVVVTIRTSRTTSAGSRASTTGGGGFGGGGGGFGGSGRSFGGAGATGGRGGGG